MKSQTFPTISYADWRRRVETELGGLGFDDVLLGHADGVDFETLCTVGHPDRPDASPIDTDRPTQSPDELSWTLCQQFDQSDPGELNHHLKSELGNGVSGIWLRLDRAGRQGEDPSTAQSVGAGGAALYRMADFASAFEDTQQEEWRTLFLDAGACFLPAAAILVGWLGQSGIDLENRTLLLGADPLGTLARDGSLPASLPTLSDDMAVLIRQSRKLGTRTRALAISTQPYREAGAEIDQELAIGLSTGAEYLRWMEKCDLEPAVTAAELALVTSTGQQIFLEIAKLRALRILWSHMLQACDVPLSTTSPWIHASVLRRNLPSREPSINLLRVTTAATAAILGGAQSIETPAYDWFDGVASSNRGSRLARNTQLILGLEAQLGRVMDPGAGSFFLESVTRELVVRGWALFQEIERQGGLSEALDSGWLQHAVDGRWEKRCREVEQGEIPLTGVNMFVDPDAGFQSVSDGENSGVQDSIRQRFAAQRKGYGPCPNLDLSTSEDRWQWCLKSANEQRSIAAMRTALYGADPGPVVKPLQPRRDSQPYEDEAVGS